MNPMPHEIGANAKGEIRKALFMAATTNDAIAQLERLAAWHRLNANHADDEWLWEARLMTAEQLEQTAAKLRAGLSRTRSESRTATTPIAHDSWRLGIAI